MSALHERLLAVAENGQPGDGVDDHELRLYAAVRAVVERHAPVACCGGLHHICSGCGSGRAADDCPDIMAIASALGVETGETPK